MRGRDLFFLKKRDHYSTGCRCVGLLFVSISRAATIVNLSKKEKSIVYVTQRGGAGTVSFSFIQGRIFCLFGFFYGLFYNYYVSIRIIDNVTWP